MLSSCVKRYTPTNKIRGSHVLFLSSFHSNDAILSQFQALVCLCESFIESLTVVLPYYPVGTMERTTKEGVVATANTVAKMLSSLPPVGRPIRVIIYDIHALQNRYYFSGHALADTVSTIPLLLHHIKAYPEGGEPGVVGDSCTVNAIAFPDEGAKKRFGDMFPGFEIIICGKVCVCVCVCVYVCVCVCACACVCRVYWVCASRVCV
jgi:phosphoribosylpyrophosphate synthetase